MLPKPLQNVPDHFLQNMFPYRSQRLSVLGQPFFAEVTLAGWGDCGGSYLVGPHGRCK
jgi:hypothetical protein